MSFNQQFLVGARHFTPETTPLQISQNVCGNNTAKSKIQTGPESYSTHLLLLGRDQTVKHLFQKTWDVSQCPVDAKTYVAFKTQQLWYTTDATKKEPLSVLVSTAFFSAISLDRSSDRKSLEITGTDFFRSLLPFLLHNCQCQRTE